MKITLIRKDEEQGTEALSLCDTDAFFEKVKTENKAGHISELREILPRLAGSSARYVHIDKLPRVYPAVEYTRKQKGEKRMKHYNGLVQLEVNRLADLYEVEYVKRQVEQLPQTFAAFCGSSGRSAKIWVLFALPDGTTPKRESVRSMSTASSLTPFAIPIVLNWAISRSWQRRRMWCWAASSRV